ncbi:MAG: hypothetical protein FJ255_11080 [Phycisphaerae bacterium]|nr:hypothetical protein [Phycisphaerae bacterium]
MKFQDLVRAMQVPFPNLTEANSRPTSPYDEGYNCIAWAAEDTYYWWWPDPMGQHYWPPGVQREETIEAFVQAYGLRGYSERSDATLERSKQKIAIYADGNDKPTHAARQLHDGWWASKLGPQIDIEHEFGALDGPAYGTVAVILARPSR